MEKRVSNSCIHWLSPRLRDAWDSSHHWPGIFFLHSIVKVWVKLIALIPCPQAYSLLAGVYDMMMIPYQK